MITTIEVTQEDIDKGARCSSTGCPVARAVARHLPLNTHFSINGLSVHIYHTGNEEYNYRPLPQAAQDWIVDFDSNRKVEPFSFEVDL